MSSPGGPEDAPSTDDREGVAALRAALAGGGYTGAAIRETLAEDGAFHRDTAELPLYVRMLPPGEPRSTLIKLFLLGLPVSRAEAAAAFGGLSLERLQAMGVLAPGAGDVRSAVEIVPVEDLLVVASDASREGEMPSRADHVPGPTPPTAALAGLTVRERVGSALDLGTGSGIQALLAASHADRVVGVDVNPRSIRFAAFNALLNGLDNVECREGSLFDPVEGETFDLIVCNPPYIISPESRYLFRDSGLPGDSFCEGLVRRTPEYLSEGGLAHVLVEWAHGEDEDWAAPLRRWVEGSGCDAILLRLSAHDPLENAAEANDRLRADRAAYAEAIDRWTAYYRELGIERIGWGAVVLRRRAGRNWVQAESPLGAGTRSCGHHVLRLLANQDALATLADADLLGTVFRLADDHRLEQTLFLRDGGGVVQQAVLRLEGGLGFQVGLDGISTHILSFLDGSRTLGEVLAAVASTTSEPVEGEELVRGALPGVRRLVELGFLELVSV